MTHRKHPPTYTAEFRERGIRLYNVNKHLKLTRVWRLKCLLTRDDECRIRKGNAPANFTTIKHMASNLLRLSKDKKSLHQKRHQALWNEEHAFKLITT